ncbi:hypothetical protein HYH02_007242 [Chlamydomonas schloesseri]|uniref:BACK domain-containing protein n=1 Tax=Chlamydomonas schloesseri TaxID=2026947 RepID=A0A836B511_9CHLO|nr:hypothetical protein HYH02_007242 [Chlamydomonas schloesseri]|eukprot:KAG2447785.1 hypothetical protein HYH02_007242 [Chlamydomonas schloesseri]
MSRSGSGALPELHVLLDAAEDLGPASEVLRFCYTGQLQSCGFRPLLLVRRQASYLQVPTCIVTCDKALEELANLLKKDRKPEPLLTCLSEHLLFPDPGLEPGFRPVQHALTAALLTHFGCAFGTMSSWAQLQQWMQLPEVAVAWALASEELSTDEESSVLLLVLWWLHWQQHEACALGWDEAGAAGRRLCQHVRLGCLSRPFLLVLLPQLEWLQLTPAQYAAVVGLGTAGAAERSSGVWGPGVGFGPPAGGAAAWYRGPRKQSPAAAQPLKSVRHFSDTAIHEFMSHTSSLRTSQVLSTCAAAAAVAAAQGLRVPPWHPASGRPLWSAMQPHKVHCDPESSPWAGGAVYQGGFFYGLELARRQDHDVLQSQPGHVRELRLCLAAYEALPPGLRGCMLQRAFAGVDAIVRIMCSVPTAGGISARLDAGRPLPLRDWWSHNFRDAGRASTAITLPLSAGQAAVASCQRFMTSNAHGRYLACELVLQPAPQPGAVAQPPVPVAPDVYAQLMLAGLELPYGHDAPEWDLEEADTEPDLTDDADEINSGEAGADADMREAAAAGSGSEVDGGDPDWTPKAAGGAGGQEYEEAQVLEAEVELEEGPFRAVMVELLRRDMHLEGQGSGEEVEQE